MKSGPVQFGLALFLALYWKRRWSLELALAAAAGFAVLCWLFDRFTRFEHHFQVVYIVPNSGSADGKNGVVVAEGCHLKEMSATSRSLEVHLNEKELRPVTCPLFEEAGREWVLYAREEVPTSVLTDEAETVPEQPKRKKGKLNPFASRFADMKLHGPAVVAPSDQGWKPAVLGKIDMITGAASRRTQEERFQKTVTLEAVQKVNDDITTGKFVKQMGAACANMKEVIDKAMATCTGENTDEAQEETTADTELDKDVPAVSIQEQADVHEES